VIEPSIEPVNVRPARRHLLALATRLSLATMVAVPALALVAPTSEAAASGTAIAPVPGGPVLLDGNDPGDHASANMTSYIRGVYANLDANVAPGYVHNGKTAVIGPCAPIFQTIAPPGEVFDSFTTVQQVRDFFNNIGANNYKIIQICDNQEDGPGHAIWSLPPAVETELSQWGFALTTHVNRGGGLISNGNNYAWLTDLFPSLVVTPGGTGSSYVTPDGSAFFQLAANTNLPAVNHFTFGNVPNPPLKTLLTELTNNGGKLVAIGGIVVQFPQIFIAGPTVADVGSAQTYTLTAARADGTLLQNNAYSYTISGVTASAGSGTGTTDANGQATFAVTGNARGTTTIRVRLGISANTAGGSQVVTTWVSLPGAPTLNSAVDTPGPPGSADLTWTAPSSPGLTPIIDYTIEQSSDGTTWTPVAHPASTGTSYTVTGLDPAGTYYFRVSAVNTDGAGPVSNVLTNPVPVAQTITFPQPSSVAENVGTTTLAASSTSGLPITYVSNASAVCTVSGSTVTIISVGTCSVTAKVSVTGLAATKPRLPP
jgi:hypothetical protein